MRRLAATVRLIFERLRRRPAFWAGALLALLVAVACLQLDCRAELHTDGPLFDNVWWHNAVFHGKLDEQVMVCFVHQRTVDTRFGGFEPVEG